MFASFMQRALAEARKAAERVEIPVGAVIVDTGGKVVAAAGNRVLEQQNPLAHAEMLVIAEACKILGNERLSGCDLYVTLEPCPMCAAAISFARIRRVYYGANDPKSGGTWLFSSPSCHHKPEIYSGISEGESAELLRGFFQERR